MPYYVIGDDKGFEEAYSADQTDALIDTQIQTVNSSIRTLETNLRTANNNISAKQKKIASGTLAPTTGNDGDIYIQY